MASRGGNRDQTVLATGPIAAGTGVLALFASTLLLSAFLLFWVEPMFTRMVLPLLGGAPAVWTTAMVFFQSALLAGYAYAHTTTRWLSRRRQIALHLGLLALASLSLPIAIGADAQPPPESSPVLWLIGLLAWSLGLPFLVLSATAPLLQLWFAGSRHPAAKDPYFLYGASNFGSMVALLGYPLLLEPTLDLAEQSRGWTLGYAALILLVGGCALVTWRGEPTRGAIVAPAPVTLPWRERLRWLALAGVPSALLLAVTAHITTDLAAVPLLWVIPLALYLLTFVLTFARRPWLRHAWLIKAQPFVLVPLVLVFAWQFAFWLAVPLHLGAFFVNAMVGHGELARRRPAPCHLTEFYLWLAAGGVLGGMFAALIAPLLFDGIWEYPIALVAACLLRPAIAAAPGRRLFDLALPLAVFGLILARAGWRGLGLPEPGAAATLSIFVPAAMLLYGMAERPLRFGLGMAAALGAGLLAADSDQILARARSFFGVYTVKQDPGGFHVLVHGTTIHGAERVDATRRREPLTYYLRDGPLGQLFAALKRDPPRTVGAVGLGVGTVACYRRSGQRWTFYEIDPLVEQIARDARYFHYLEDCAPAAEVVLGDARRSLQQAPSGHYDLLILDAFSSDAIPIHLMTREALALYLDKLSPRGVIAFHVSNRSLDLAPIVADLAAAAGVLAWRQSYQPPRGSESTYRTPSTWIAIAREARDLGTLTADPRWSRLVGRSDRRPWTDAFSNVLGALRWRLGRVGP